MPWYILNDVALEYTTVNIYSLVNLLRHFICIGQTQSIIKGNVTVSRFRIDVSWMKQQNLDSSTVQA